MSPRRNPFYWRAFVTFFVVFAFLALVASGLVLYIAPPGRIANWSNWTFGALQKANWQAMHTIFAFLFVAAAAFHVYFNWRVILNYVKTKLGEGMRRGRELAVSATLAAAVLAATLGGLPPFSTVMSVGEEVKNSWGSPQTEPPVPHAELWSLARLADTTKVPLDTVTTNLERAGITAGGPDVTLEALAASHGRTPREIYDLALRDARPAPVPVAEGGGYGRKSVRDLADQLQIPVATALERLRRDGIVADADSNIRELALRHGRLPIDVVKIATGNAP